ncbi:hypothetical protein [Rhizorhabdus dicambivorans]|uniref:Major facilitator superfamily (MFS) profile domain-containing protein n=1 Tax=Rhizorhabdus dicambivorans TaxID=1850238 RepID=A0A2A4FWD2_9SPHN|nr:hypothetical protein [Rhizorhabdus dicambivorans]ATE66120.1 hypothetical protein CMV14_18340 [Rhizorhabdus dicambivorans]PCE42045.1 hypothetical protein COO09_12045 [Rhizorhabdus dicambivorans]
MQDGVGTGFYIMLALAGAAIVGAQFCLSAVINLAYPAAIRATGAGYASGIGRLGAIGAPFAGSLVMAASPGAAGAFTLGALPVALALIALIAMARLNLFVRFAD